MKIPIVLEQIKIWLLGTVAVIVSAMKIPFRNPKFIALTLITTIPLFCTTLLSRLPSYIHDQLIEVFIEALVQLKIVTSTFDTLGSLDMSWVVVPIIQLLIVYIFGLVNFFTALTTIYASSTIHTSNGDDHNASMGLGHLLMNSVTKTPWRNAFFTFIPISMLFDCCLMYVFFAIYAQSLLISRSGCNLFLKALPVIVLTMGGVKRMEYTAWWNLTVVVSILEPDEQKGFQEFSTSSQLMKGNKLRGIVLMYLVYSVRRIDTLILIPGGFPSRNPSSVYLDMCLLCLGKIVTWMVSTIYYLDCKNRQQQKSFVAISSSLVCSSVQATM